MRKDIKPIQILLLEDDWVLKHTLCKVLSKRGYKCHHPKNTEEAFSLLNKGAVVLVVADINMAWINTLELCQMIKRSKHFSHIPFIFISGSS